jgi:hypothetical protein
LSGEHPVQRSAKLDDGVEHIAGVRIAQLGIGEPATADRIPDMPGLARGDEVPYRVADDDRVGPADSLNRNGDQVGLRFGAVDILTVRPRVSEATTVEELQELRRPGRADIVAVFLLPARPRTVRPAASVSSVIFLSTTPTASPP